MKLYVIRHAIAAAPAHLPDAMRPLSTEGQRKFRLAAKGLTRLKPRIDLILFSPLLRARQTAEILAEALEGICRRPIHLEKADCLAPPGRLDAFILQLMELKKAATGVAVVGHEPVLSDWIGQICFNEPGRCELKKGGMALLELEASAGRGKLKYLLPPGVLRKMV